MRCGNITRADAASVAQLAKFGVATIHEAMGRVGLLETYMRPIYPGAKACGTAVTIFAHPGDNWMLHVAAEMLQPGDVAVLGPRPRIRDGMFGDLLATSFRARGAVGLVIDAGCRDTAELRDMEFPGLVEGHQCQGHGEGHPRVRQYPDHLRRRAGASRRRGGRRRRRRGDRAQDARLRELPPQPARARDEGGRHPRKRLAAGELGLDVYGMREPLAKAGLKYFDDEAAWHGDAEMSAVAEQSAEDLSAARSESRSSRRLRLPPGACDAHCHVFGPAAKFPYARGPQLHAARRAGRESAQAACVISASRAPSSCTRAVTERTWP